VSMCCKKLNDGKAAVEEKNLAQGTIYWVCYEENDPLTFQEAMGRGSDVGILDWEARHEAEAKSQFESTRSGTEISREN